MQACKFQCTEPHRLVSLQGTSDRIIWTVSGRGTVNLAAAAGGDESLAQLVLDQGGEDKGRASRATATGGYESVVRLVLNSKHLK
jgi:hypothetical protein